ncbi:MAG: GntR family transcriptional regulator/MocR family aminotransferase [Oceanicoccus sp.]|jgi:GntR family transcriptional regulator/MocR family aminotransferase
MEKTLIYLDPDSELNLQSQIRQKLVEAIMLGTFPAGKKLPSSRKLADQLTVARNTVVLVYQQLIDEEYLVSRERSGIYVNEKIMAGHVGFEGKSDTAVNITSQWQQRFKGSLSPQKEFSAPPNWQQYPFPFIDGQFDTSLYPVKEWREASRLALGVREINQWAGETGDADDPMLIEEIRTKILPRRGIQAGPDEILITVGTQHALYLVSQLLVDDSISVAVEEPGYPATRQLLDRRGANLIHQPVDKEGMLIDEHLDDCQLVFVTPSHQTPTGVTMSMARREALLKKASLQDFLVVEDDFEFESNYLGHPHPALRSIDNENRVIYMSCLSKVLSPGLRLGFMVAAPEVIAEARKLSGLMVRHPPLNNQRSAAFFLSLGYYDTFLLHLYETFEQRWIALRRAVNYYLLPYVEITPAQGGTALWIRVSSDINVKHLVQEAAKRGILLEPMEHYYACEQVLNDYFRMGVTSIPAERIREGVDKLRDLIHDLTTNKIESFANSRGTQLLAGDIPKVLANTTMFTPVAYGEPCSIELYADGSLVGKAGYANEDCDTGKWWVEGDHWCRQWSRWAWADIGIYQVVMDDEIFKLFDEQGRLIDQGVLKKTEPSSEENT